MSKHTHYIATFIVTYIILPLILTLSIPATSAQTTPDTASNRFDFGFQHRARFIDFDNIIDYTDANEDHNQFFRFRTRLWGRYKTSNLEFKLQLTNEFRHYNEPDKDDNFDEIFIDLCYLKLNNLFGSDWSMTLGRQNMIKNDGFVFFDGSPLDGSRSIYYNAFVLKRTFESSALELYAISNPAQDDYLPIIGDKDRQLIEHDEEALGVYYTKKLPSKATFDAGYMYKIETWPHDEYSPNYEPDRHIHILTGRTTVPVGKAGMFNCELGFEFGEEKPHRDITAWAGYTGYKHTFKAAMKPHFRFSIGALSGDDPGSSRQEGWIPPFSRWPQWSELYIYSLIPEGGVAYWSDLCFANAEFVIHPTDTMKLRLSYYKMKSIRKSMNPNQSKNRGDLYQVRADFKLLKGLTGHAVYEYMVPGEFHEGDDPGHFLRFELNYAFSHGFDL